MKVLVYGIAAVVGAEYLGNPVASAIGVTSPTMNLLTRAAVGGTVAWGLHKVWK